MYVAFVDIGKRGNRIRLQGQQNNLGLIQKTNDENKNREFERKRKNTKINKRRMSI